MYPELPQTDEEYYAEVQDLPEAQRYIDRFDELRRAGLSVEDAALQAIGDVNRERGIF